MDKCPMCGSDYGLYTKHYGVRYDQYYTFKGDTDGYGELSEDSYHKDKKVYCCDCHKFIGMYSKLFPEKWR